MGGKFGFFVSLILFLMAEVTVIKLGIWQWNRMHEKEALKAEMQALIESTPQTYSPDLAEYTPVSLAGQWDTQTPTFYLANIRSESHMHVGYRFLKPFVLENSAQTLLIDAGWAHNKEEVAWGEGVQSLIGIIRAFPERKGWLQGPTESIEPNTLLFFDPQAIPVEGGNSIELVYVQLIEPVVENLNAFHAPLPDSAQHKEYMLTWFIIALIWPVMYGFALRRFASKSARKSV